MEYRVIFALVVSLCAFHNGIAAPIASPEPEPCLAALANALVGRINATNPTGNTRGPAGANPPNTGTSGASSPNTGTSGASSPNTGTSGANPPNTGTSGANPPNTGTTANN